MNVHSHINLPEKANIRSEGKRKSQNKKTEGKHRKWNEGKHNT